MESGKNRTANTCGSQYDPGEAPAQKDVPLATPQVHHTPLICLSHDGVSLSTGQTHLRQPEVDSRDHHVGAPCTWGGSSASAGASPARVLIHPTTIPRPSYFCRCGDDEGQYCWCEKKDQETMSCRRGTGCHCNCANRCSRARPPPQGQHHCSRCCYWQPFCGRRTRM